LKYEDKAAEAKISLFLAKLCDTLNCEGERARGSTIDLQKCKQKTADLLAEI
jgi:hypothetical protein